MQAERPTEVKRLEDPARDLLGQLGISMGRRIIGAILVLGMYVVAIVAYVHYRQRATHGNLLPLDDIEVHGLVALVCAIVVTPHILIPCVMDRFPRWLVDSSTPEKLQKMAKMFFGVQ